MKQSSKTLRKMLAVALAVATIGSAGILTEVGTVVGTEITANAANYELHTYNNITYALYSDGTAEAVSYSGSNKDFSSTYFSVPSVVYAKNLGKDYILDRSQFTVTKMQADGFSGIKARIFSLPNKLQVLFGGFRNTQIGCFGIATDNAYFSISPSAGGILLNRSGTEIVAYPTKPSLYYSSDFISIPSTVTRIGDFAFTGYKATSITIPSTVTYVGNAAFEYSSLQSITFNGNPSFYRASGESVCSFDNATNLTSINIKGTSGSYSTDTYGMLYNKDKTKFIYCPLGRTSAFNVADTCTEIVDWAFHNSSAKPVIYDNVTKISVIAFDGVKSGFKLYCLKDTAIETYAKNNNINYGYHFEYTVSGNNVTVTKYSGPYNGPSLPEKVKGKTITAIGAEAFKGNTTLDGVYLSSTKITSIGDRAFSGCTKLKNIYLPSTVTSIGEYAFNSTIATSITIPSSMAAIGDYAFYGMSKLESISIPSKVTKIGSYAFGHCKALTSVTIPNNVTSVGFGAFYNCTKLSSLTIGSGVTSIGGTSFCNTALTSQYIPKTVTSIGSYAFGYKYADSTYTRDSAFTEISGYPNTAAQTYAKNNNIPFKSLLQYSTSSDGKSIRIEKYTGTDTVVVIPDKIDGLPVTSIKGYAFDGTNVTKITLPSGMTKLDGYALYGASKLTTVVFPSGLTSIGEYAFEFCTSLKSITIPNTVTSIGNGAFYACNQLASVNLGTGVKTIDDYAFENTALTSVTIPESVTSIGAYAFGYTWADNTHTMVDGFTMTGYPNTAAQTYCTNYNVPFKSLLQYSKSSDGKSIKIEKYTGTDIVVVIPDKIDGLPVTSIARYAFNGTNVTKVTLPSGMTALDGYAFCGARKLTTVVFPSGLTSIGNAAFEFCTSLKSITIPNTVTSIENDAFYACHQLASVNLGTGVKTIGDYAFENTALTSVTIPKSVTYIGNYAFGDIWTDDTHTMVDGFQITGYAYTAAETYANKYSITFNPLYESMTNTSTISKTAITLGQSININFSSTGGKRPMTYAAMYSFEGGSSVSIQSYSTNTSTIFTPLAAGTYAIYIYAKDDSGNFIRKDFTLTVETLPVENTCEIWNYDQKGQTNFSVDDTVYIATGATGGSGSYSYSIYYHTPGVDNWQTAVENSTKTGEPFHLTDENGDVHAGQYEIMVVARDTDGKFDSKKFNVTVYDRLVVTSTISAETVTVGDEIEIIMSATGGCGDYLYDVKYRRYGDGEWNESEKGFSTTYLYYFTPDVADTYEYLVFVKDEIGTVNEKSFIVEVKEESKELKNTSRISIEGEVYLDDTITVNAGAQGGKTPYTYAVYYRKTSSNSWTTVQGFKSNATVEFKFPEVADYEVCVKVKDADGTIVKDYYELSVIVDEERLVNESTISSETAAVGAKVTFTGKASGGTGDYQYAFLYKKASENKWVNKQSFAANDTVSIKPEAAVDYDVCIKVKDSSGTVEKKYFTLHVNEALANTSTISSLNIGKGQTVTVSAAGRNGVGPYTYSVLYKQKSKTKWTTKQDFSQNSQIEVKPASTGLYDVCVKVKDSLGTIAKTYFEVNVAAAVTSNSTISATEIKKGESVTVKAAAQNGIAPYTYSVQYKQQSKSKWTTQQEFDANDTIVVTPASAVAYDICVKVQDGTGTVAKQYFTVTVS